MMENKDRYKYRGTKIWAAKYRVWVKNSGRAFFHFLFHKIMIVKWCCFKNLRTKIDTSSESSIPSKLNSRIQNSMYKSYFFQWGLISLCRGYVALWIVWLDGVQSNSKKADLHGFWSHRSQLLVSTGYSWENQRPCQSSSLLCNSESSPPILSCSPVVFCNRTRPSDQPAVLQEQNHHIF